MRKSVAKFPVLLITVLAVSFACAAKVQTKSGFVTTSDGTKIHYIEAGQGAPIVLVPGWTMPAEIWQPQIDALSAKYRVIAIDPRSQGDSDKPAEGNYPEQRARDYREVIEHLKLERPVLVGWSMAVAEVLAYVDQFGADGLRGVVLVDGLVKFDPAMSAGFPVFFKGFAVDRKKSTAGFVKSMYQKPQSEAYLSSVTRASLKTPTNTAMALIFAAVGTPDMSGTLTKLANVPVLYEYEPGLQGQADIVKAKLPSVSLHKYEAGHALFVDEAEKFNQAIVELMERTAGK